MVFQTNFMDGVVKMMISISALLTSTSTLFGFPPTKLTMSP